MPAPDKAAVTRRDDLLHVVDTEVDTCQDLHRIRRAGRRGNGARGGFGNHESVRGYDRHDDHRRAIAGNATDAMLVDHDRSIPLELCSRCSHGMSEGQKLVARHETGGADKERGDLHVGIAIVRQIIDNGADFGRAQRVAPNFPAHGVEADGRSSRGDGHPFTDGLGEAAECRLGESKIIRADEIVVVRDKQGCQQYFGVASKLDPAESAKHLGPQRFGPPRDHGDILAAGIQIDATDLQFRTECAGAIH